MCICWAVFVYKRSSSKTKPGRSKFGISGHPTEQNVPGNRAKLVSMSLDSSCSCIVTGKAMTQYNLLPSASDVHSLFLIIAPYYFFLWPKMLRCLEKGRVDRKGAKCHVRRSGKEREKGETEESEIVYLARLVTVHWLTSSSHALDFRQPPHQWAERRLFQPVRFLKTFHKWISIGCAQRNKWRSYSHWPEGIFIFSGSCFDGSCFLFNNVNKLGVCVCVVFWPFESFSGVLAL